MKKHLKEKKQNETSDRYKSLVRLNGLLDNIFEKMESMIKEKNENNRNIRR